MQIRTSDIFTTGLAIFSMLFGAGNLIYPLLIGMTSGPLTWVGMIGFLLTATFLPLLGLIAMILFDGDYKAFFHRLGTMPGSFLIAACMIIIGPGLAIPRIVTLSHIMIAPFIPIALLQQSNMLASFIFAILFLGVTFLATYKESKIIDVLGKIISPVLLLCLVIIIGKGLINADTIVPASDTAYNIFMTNIIRGYETLDLLGAIFFASIIISLLKSKSFMHHTVHELATVGFKAGFIGIFLLCLVYIGMSVISMYHSHGMHHLGAGALFRDLSFSLLGTDGTIVISLAVLMACLSTAIALVVVFAEYVQHTIFNKAITYVTALSISIASCIPLSICGLDYVLALTGGPIVYIGYPVIIALTLCNIAYKWFHFTWVKLPVAATFVLACISYFF